MGAQRTRMRQEQQADHQTAAKSCNCRKTNCLYLYCECFAAGQLCGPLCKCSGCKNTKDNERGRKKAQNARLARNRQAFAPKFRQDPDGSRYSHTRGCNCRRSNCVKKYCECFNAGVSCTGACKCEDCENDGRALYMQDLGLVDWVLPGGREPTCSAVGVETVLTFGDHGNNVPTAKHKRNYEINRQGSQLLELRSPAHRKRRMSDPNRLSDDWKLECIQQPLQSPAKLEADQQDAELEADLIALFRDSSGIRDSSDRVSSPSLRTSIESGNKQALQQECLQVITEIDLPEDLLRLSISPGTQATEGTDGGCVTLVKQEHAQAGETGSAESLTVLVQEANLQQQQEGFTVQTQVGSIDDWLRLSASPATEDSKRKMSLESIYTDSSIQDDHQMPHTVAAPAPQQVNNQISPVKRLEALEELLSVNMGDAIEGLMPRIEAVEKFLFGVTSSGECIERLEVLEQCVIP